MYAPSMSTFRGIHAGDRVTVRTPLGQFVTGRAQALLIFRDYCVIDAGGKHGRPIVANEVNTVSVQYQD